MGGSHGLNSVHLCQRAPSLVAEILNLSPVEPHAQRTIQQYGLQDRVRFRAGDFLQDDLGSGYDVVLDFNIIHMLSGDGNAALAAKVHKALNPSGIYVARYSTATLGLHLFQQTGGYCHAYSEICEWMNAAGFGRCKLLKLRTAGTGLVVACR
jgi:cyclopropane fatty-acyl-phospholipid synthase-like methyltransferase